MGSEFYVGYNPRAPKSLARFTRRAVIVIGVLAGAVSTLLTIHQDPLSDSRFEFNVFRSYEGVLRTDFPPVFESGGRDYMLVAPGKHGFVVAKTLAGNHVRLRGAQATREGQHLLEVEPGSLAVLKHQGPAVEEEQTLGRVTLKGEIVDSKCYLGVMNPGHGKVHRDCAVRCISGGIPPALAVRDADGALRIVLLTGAEGAPINRDVLPYVGEQVAVDGLLAKRGKTMVLRADPTGIRRQ